MKSLYSLILAAACAVGAWSQVPRRPASTQDIQAKVALEGSVEHRLQEVLRKVLGSETVVVVVNVDLLADAERGDTEILPGVALKDSPGAGDAPLELPAALVRRLAVTVFLDKNLPDASAELAKNTAAKMVGLKTDRGDTVVVEKMDFPKPAPVPAGVRIREELLTPKGLLALSWLLVAWVALIVLARRFFDPFVQAARDAARGLAEKSSNAGAPAAAAVAAEAASAPERRDEERERSSGGPDEPKRHTPFSFVRGRDLSTLTILLAEQPARAAATIVNYLAPEIASAALAAMTPERREEVVAQMSRPTLLNPDDVKLVEDEIRERIDYMIGGEDKLADILEQSPVDMQTEILSALRFSDEELWERLQRRVVTLDDLALLDEAGLSALSRAVPLKSMAAALKASPALARKVTAKLKTGLGQWLKQEIELSGRIPDDQAQIEMRRVVKAFSQLVRDGRIVLHKNFVMPPVAGEEPPPAAAEAPPASEGPAA